MKWCGLVRAVASLLIILAVCAAAQQPAEPPHSTPPQATGVVSTGAAHAAVLDSEKRPITAGGFVDSGPVVFQDISEKGTSKSNRFDESIPLLVRAGEIAPGEFKVHYEMAKAYFDSTQWEPARRQAEEAVKLNPNDSSGHYLLGRVYQRLGRKELAEDEFRRTAELIRDKAANSHGGMASGVSSC